ncbi:MAG TPA: alpha-amylase family glycosyl hydrolase [Chitinophagaceae bacterium]|nr:alpha-amylase family glycosyl hydrolase [Chitinophagaceae bacterium]
MIRKIVFTCTAILWCIAVCAQPLKIYPTNWFTGMKDNKLQLIIHAPGVADKVSQIKLSQAGMNVAPGMLLTAIHRPENKNYIFLDLLVDKQAKPGERTITLGPKDKGLAFSYTLKAKNTENGSTRVKGVNASDFIYLIMPDRFSNGDPANDIIPGYRDETSERKNKFSRHGGDFKGIENHFDYLQHMGVTTIWMTPVIENNTSLMHEWGNKVAGYHGYWFTDHYEIDKRFGGNEGYKAFCDAAHKQGMKVIQDAVYNHISKEHWSATDPPMKDWINTWPAFTGPNHREEVLFDPYASAHDKKNMLDGWFTDHLPDLNQRNPFVATYLIQHALWSTETYGIDGWRVDTYKYCDEKFLNDVNIALYREFPQVTVFGEAWVNSVIGNAYFTRNTIASPFQHNPNGVIDFQTCFALLSAMNKANGWMDGVNKIYTTLAQDVVYANPMNNCIFLDNHDMDRAFSVVGEDWQKLKAGINWLLTLRGIPQLYYGTEVLMKNTKATTDAMVREDFPGGWKEDLSNKFTKEGRSEAENRAYDHISALGRFRKQSSALTTGRLVQFVPKDGCYIYFRYDDQQTVMVVANTGKNAIRPDWNIYKERINGFSAARDVISNRVQPLQDIELQPGDSYVFELKK